MDECKPLIAGMEAWLAEPNLMQADSDAEYHTIIDINMDLIKAWAYTRPHLSST